MGLVVISFPFLKVATENKASSMTVMKDHLWLKPHTRLLGQVCNYFCVVGGLHCTKTVKERDIKKVLPTCYEFLNHLANNAAQKIKHLFDFNRFSIDDDYFLPRLPPMLGKRLLAEKIAFKKECNLFLTPVRPPLFVLLKTGETHTRTHINSLFNDTAFVFFVLETSE